MLKNASKNKKAIIEVYILRLLIMVFMCIPYFSYAQDLKSISGTVKDISGVSLPGVSIVGTQSGRGAISDNNGDFNLQVLSTDSLRFEAIGFQTQAVYVGDVNNFSIIMTTAEESNLSDVVVVGYTTQRRANLTGAVSQIGGDEIIATKNENLQNMVTGRLPGLRVSQRSSEPGSFDVAMDIRAMGTPLIVIDGVPRGMEDFQRLNPNDIESISILKDATAAVYGVRSANGVVLVTTKKGKAGESQISYSGSYTFQIPSGMPATTDAVEYMILRNEASMHRREGANRIFSDDDINEYLSGAKQSTDWYSLVFKDYAPQTTHNLSATGGTEKIKYYFGVGYQDQQSFFNTNDLNYKRFNIRSNITAQVAKNLTADLNINLIQDIQNRPFVDSWWIIRGYWKQGPHIPPYANNDPSRLYHNRNDGDNPLAFINSDIVGSHKYTRRWVQPTLSLKYDFPFLPGMFVKGLVAYDWNNWEANDYRKEYNQYEYDATNDRYNVFSLGSPAMVHRGTIMRSQLLTQTSLGYTKKFNNVHNFNGLLVWETQERDADNFNAQRNLILPLPYIYTGLTEDQIGGMNTGDLYKYTNVGLVGAFHYDYDNKYLLDFSFRNDASSKFPADKQWAFFPSVAAAWRVSEESFIKNNFTMIDQLKLRASYGMMGDDGALRYQHLTGYNYPTGGSDRRWFTAGYVFNGFFLASADDKGIPNPNITWFNANTFDVGFDLVGWKGLFGITADYFSRKREGLLAQRYGGIPTVVGANLPQENINSDRTYGFEVELSHRNNINDFRYGLKGMLTFVRVKRLYWERGPLGSTWDAWYDNHEQNNRMQGVRFMQQGDGQFQNWDEIWNSKVFVDPWVVPGDYRYLDWNGDGEINGNDRHPITYDQNPWMNFSLSGDAQYKGFDFSFLLQGAALTSVPYGEKLREPLWGGGDAGALQQFMDRWHPKDPNADPYNRNTEWVKGRYAYTGTLPDYWSTFNVEDGSYLRLKSIELGYSLPVKLLERAKIRGVRVYASAYNLVTLTKVKNIDPEHTDALFGYIYPLNKSVSVGLNITF